jgi:tetratricopeptide (TPR) repeat protein
VRSAWALDTLRLYREMRPECSEGAALMAEALAKNPATMPDEAEVALRDALCRDPRRRVCLVELARLLSEADRLAEAMEFYQRAIDAGEDDEDGLVRGGEGDDARWSGAARRRSSSAIVRTGSKIEPSSSRPSPSAGA